MPDLKNYIRYVTPLFDAVYQNNEEMINNILVYQTKIKNIRFFYYFSRTDNKYS